MTRRCRRGWGTNQKRQMQAIVSAAAQCPIQGGYRDAAAGFGNWASPGGVGGNPRLSASVHLDGWIIFRTASIQGCPPGGSGVWGVRNWIYTVSRTATNDAVTPLMNRAGLTFPLLVGPPCLWHARWPSNAATVVHILIILVGLPLRSFPACLDAFLPPPAFLLERCSVGNQFACLLLIRHDTAQDASPCHSDGGTAEHAAKVNVDWEEPATPL